MVKLPRWTKATASDKPAALVRFPLALTAVILAALIVLSGTAILLWLGLGSPRLGATPAPTATASPTSLPRAQLTTQDQLQLVQIVLIITGGIGGVVALVVAYRKQRIAEDAHRWADEANQRAIEASTRDDTRLFNERFAAASAQLGHESAAVRLAGVYAIAGLADDWHAGRQTCIDVLCAYLRMPYQPDREVTTGPAWREGEQQVRWSIIRIVRDHLQDHSDNPERQARTWQGRHLDFTGVTFDGGDFRGAQFTGNTTFAGATFCGGTVSFVDAGFSNDVVRFSGATFSGSQVQFTRATFSGGEVQFHRVTFSGGSVGFYGAEFSNGMVLFNRATFSGGTVDFDGARFSGAEVQFMYTKFCGARVGFMGATFSDGVVLFYGARFSGGEVAFNQAAFCGGTVGFTKATFSGGAVAFYQATFSGGEVQFDSASFSGSAVGFHKAIFSGGAVLIAPVASYQTPPMFDEWSTPPSGLLLPQGS